jgi:hypothetical protein
MYILLREHSGKVNRGGISMPQMTKDVFHLSYSQSRPLLISDCHWNFIQGNNIDDNRMITIFRGFVISKIVIMIMYIMYFYKSVCQTRFL